MQKIIICCRQKITALLKDTGHVEHNKTNDCEEGKTQ